MLLLLQLEFACFCSTLSDTPFVKLPKGFKVKSKGKGEHSQCGRLLFATIANKGRLWATRFISLEQG
jgi:hypothetical protein